MPPKFAYLFINLLSAIVPLLFSAKKPVSYYKSFKALFLSIGITALLFLVHDYYFTQKAYWGFNDKYLCGIKFSVIPLEEILFFICIPFACMFIYRIVGQFVRFHEKKSKKIIFFFDILILISSLLLCVLFNHRAYTFQVMLLNFLYAALRLLSPHFRLNAAFYIAYIISLFPFMVVNGILTGSFIQEPIVWYNATEIMGLRVGTIPFEDFYYSFLMLSICAALYDFFTKKLAE